MKTYRFEAKIEPADGGGAYVLFPYDTRQEFATGGKVPIKATLDGVPYTGSLIKYGSQHHMLGVPRRYARKLAKAREMPSRLSSGKTKSKGRSKCLLNFRS